MRYLDSDSGDRPALTISAAFFRHWKLFTFIVISAFLLAALVTFTAKKQYRSEMKFVLENNRVQAAISSGSGTEERLAEMTDEQVNTEIELMESEDILGKLADPGWSSVPASNLTPDVLREHERRFTDLSQRLTVSPGHKSNVITVTCVAKSSAEAQQTLERFAVLYLTQRKALARPGGVSSFYTEETGRYEDLWKSATANLVAFQQENNLVSVPDLEKSLSDQIASNQEALRTSRANLSDVEGRLSAGRQAVASLPVRQKSEERITYSQAPADQMRSQLLTLQNRRTELMTRFTPTNRLVVEVDQQITDTTQALNAALSRKGEESATDISPTWQQVNTMSSVLQIERQGLREHTSFLEQSINKLQQNLSRLESLNVEFNALQSKANEARDNYRLFSQKRDQALIEDAMDERQMINTAIAEHPTLPFNPFTPHHRQALALGIAAGLFLGAAALYLAELSRNTFATTHELEAFSNFQVLASFPETPQLRGSQERFGASPHRNPLLNQDELEMRNV